MLLLKVGDVLQVIVLLLKLLDHVLLVLNQIALVHNGRCLLTGSRFAYFGGLVTIRLCRSRAVDRLVVGDPIDRCLPFVDRAFAVVRIAAVRRLIPGLVFLVDLLLAAVRGVIRVAVRNAIREAIREAIRDTVRSTVRNAATETVRTIGRFDALLRLVGERVLRLRQVVGVLLQQQLVLGLLERLLLNAALALVHIDQYDLTYWNVQAVLIYVLDGLDLLNLQVLVLHLSGQSSSVREEIR